MVTQCNFSHYESIQIQSSMYTSKHHLSWCPIQKNLAEMQKNQHTSISAPQGDHKRSLSGCSKPFPHAVKPQFFLSFFPAAPIQFL